MSLLRYIVKGFGWELGKTAAQEAVDELRSTGADSKRAEKDARQKQREAAKAAKAAEKAAKKARKARATESKRREREVEDELAALKKRMDRES